MKFLLLPAALLASSALATAQAVQPEDFSVEFGLSSAGLIIAPSYDFSEYAPGLHGRLALTFGSLDYNETDESGNTINGSFSTDSLGLFADYYPTGNGFRVSGGLMSGGYDLTASLDEISDDAGNTVTGPFSVTLAEADSVAPALTIGFSSTGSQFGGFIDVGARFNTLEVSVGGVSGLPGADQTTIDNYVNEANDELEDALSFIPILNFGVRYNF